MAFKKGGCENNDGINKDSSLCGCEAQNDGKDEILRRPFASLRASA